MQKSDQKSQSPAGSVEFSVIVPTLNEGTHISKLMRSLRSQSIDAFEVIIVDGGSSDDTVRIAGSLGARVFVLKGSNEFEARNYAAALARAPVLVFSCADVIFPSSILEMVLHRFQDNSDLVALTGPDVPYDGRPALRFLYGSYNALRILFSRLPYPLKVFSSSTNFLVVRRKVFWDADGFVTRDVNADGLIGGYLVKRYKVLFDNKVMVYVSGRRAQSWGIVRFIRHYLYVLENFFPKIARQKWFMRLKDGSRKSHVDIHTKANIQEKHENQQQTELILP